MDRSNESGAARAFGGVDALYAVLCVASVVPLLAFEHPRIVDFANHWARLHVACRADDPVFGAMYEVRFGLIPNLISDLINIALCDIVSPRDVLLGTLVVAHIGILLVLYGVQRRLWGRAQATLTLAPLLMFNAASSMGYVNYVFGLFVALVLVYLVLARPDRPLASFLLLTNLFGAFIFLCHAFALAFIGVFILAHVYDKRAAGLPMRRRLLATVLVTAAAFALPAALVLLAEPSASEFRIDYLDKVRALVAPTLAASPVADVAITAAVACLAFYLWKSRATMIAPAVRLPLAALAATVLVVPAALFDAVDIDARIAAGLALLLVASVGVTGPDRRVGTVVMTAACVLLAARMLAIWKDGTAFDRHVAEFRSSLSVVPARAAVLSVYPDDPTDACDGLLEARQPYWHLASFATIDRAAFNPLNFTGRGMQPMQASAAYAHIDVAASTPVPVTLLEMSGRPERRSAIERVFRKYDVSTYFVGWPAHFDYVVHYHFGCPERLLPHLLSEVAEGSFFTIYAVRRPAPSLPR
ncbi:MAG TPA: hypothetical protein VF342_08275 [Alphaproteobacteria bacterium]